MSDTPATSIDVVIAANEFGHKMGPWVLDRDDRYRASCEHCSRWVYVDRLSGPTRYNGGPATTEPCHG